MVAAEECALGAVEMTACHVHEQERSKECVTRSYFLTVWSPTAPMSSAEQATKVQAATSSHNGSADSSNNDRLSLLHRGSRQVPRYAHARSDLALSNISLLICGAFPHPVPGMYSLPNCTPTALSGARNCSPNGIQDVVPPSTTMVWPIMNLASSHARNATAAPMSSGVPT